MTSIDHLIMEAKCVVFFDLSKAFDSVPHAPLLNKIGVHPVVQRWILSYLLHRKQVVVVDGAQSTPKPGLSGVPQGSVLGPLLFLIYINDVSGLMDDVAGVNVFADDIALYREIKCSSDYQLLQADIDKIVSCIRSICSLTVVNAATCWLPGRALTLFNPPHST